jgi:hypothetical protein
MNLANRVRNALCSKYGCVLGEGKIVGGELAHEDPVASLFGRILRFGRISVRLITVGVQRTGAYAAGCCY